MPRERLLTLKEAAAWLESEYGLKRSPLTVWGWHRYGRQGVLLAATSIAGRWHTSPDALRRFFAECTKRHGEGMLNELELTG